MSDELVSARERKRQSEERAKQYYDKIRKQEMRRVLKAIVLNQEPGDVSTIESEESVEEARQAWEQIQSQLKARQPVAQS